MTVKRRRTGAQVPRAERQDAYGRRWAQIAKRVLARDLHRCRWRLKGCTGKATLADHVVPAHRGGPSTAENAVGSCQSCNVKKGRTQREEDAAVKALAEEGIERPFKVWHPLPIGSTEGQGGPDGATSGPQSEPDADGVPVMRSWSRESIQKYKEDPAHIGEPGRWSRKW
jgi:HNH endonuclease